MIATYIVTIVIIANMVVGGIYLIHLFSKLDEKDGEEE